ncbi:MAG: alpha/beta hydrolase [Acidobacteriota bacterium]
MARFVAGVFALLGIAGVSLYRAEVPVEDLVDDFAGGASSFETIEGTSVHYRDEGTGPTLLLLHGTASSLHTWDGWVHHLKDRFRILRLDLQGFGLTGPNGDHDYSAERQVRVIAELLRRRGVERCSVAGNSLGGRIAWGFALDHPQRVDRLILVDSAGPRALHVPPEPHVQDDGAKVGRRAGGGRTLDLGRVPILKDLLTRLTPRFLVERSLRQVYGDPTRVRPELVDRYHRMLLREGNRDALVRALNTRWGQTVEPEQLRDLHQPTLIQWGEDDRWIPLSVGQRLEALIPDARLVVYPGAGHVPMEEIPEETARDAAAFLLTSPGNGARADVTGL